MNMTQDLKQWGNGTAVRIPKKVREAANIEVGQSLTVTLRGRSIVLTPVAQKPTVTLDSLLKDATPENAGGEFDWGEDVGRERWYDEE